MPPFLTRSLTVVTLAPTTRAIDIDPNNAGAYSNRGNAYSALGNFAKALADYDRAIVINSDDANAYRDRASARESLDNIFQAQADMQRYRDISGAIWPHSRPEPTHKPCIPLPPRWKRYLLSK